MSTESDSPNIPTEKRSFHLYDNDNPNGSVLSEDGRRLQQGVNLATEIVDHQRRVAQGTLREGFSENMPTSIRDNLGDASVHLGFPPDPEFWLAYVAEPLRDVLFGYGQSTKPETKPLLVTIEYPSFAE